MKKSIYLTLLLLIATVACGWGKEPVNFRLFTSGLFANPEDKSVYCVVEMKGKTDQTIFDDLMMNALCAFVQPTDVVSYVNGKMINVRYHISDIPFSDENGTLQKGETYCTIRFWIRDGKVKVAAPHLEEIIYYSGSGSIGVRKKISPYELALLYSKTGDNNVSKLENPINYTINCILGILGGGNPYYDKW